MPLPHTTSLVYPIAPDSLPLRPLDQPPYVVTFANSADDLDAVLRLRFDVFNLELREGFAESYRTGRDEDAFDRVMHHLMVIFDSSFDRIFECLHATQHAKPMCRLHDRHMKSS